MKLVIVTGLSGSGKSVALHALEDIGFFCIDNLPVDLMRALVDTLVKHSQPHRENVAIGIDARSSATDLANVPRLIEEMRDQDVATRVLFLEAEDAVLLRRFSETRRRHPLADGHRALPEAVSEERHLLAEFRQSADLILDTTKRNLHQLRDQVQTIVSSHESGLFLLLRSFGFKHGMPRDADLMFDARCLSNPYWQTNLRALSGRDEAVKEFLGKDPRSQKFYDQVVDFLGTWIPCFEQEGRSYLTVAIGCTGGHHRSVFLVERLAEHFRSEGREPLVEHRDLQ